MTIRTKSLQGYLIELSTFYRQSKKFVDVGQTYVSSAIIDNFFEDRKRFCLYIKERFNFTDP